MTRVSIRVGPLPRRATQQRSLLLFLHRLVRLTARIIRALPSLRIG